MKTKYVLEVVITTEQPMLKKDVKAAAEIALAVMGKVRVRSVDRD